MTEVDQWQIIMHVAVVCHRFKSLVVPTLVTFKMSSLIVNILTRVQTNIKHIKWNIFPCSRLSETASTSKRYLACLACCDRGDSHALIVIIIYHCKISRVAPPSILSTSQEVVLMMMNWQSSWSYQTLQTIQ